MAEEHWEDQLCTAHMLTTRIRGIDPQQKFGHSLANAHLLAARSNYGRFFCNLFVLLVELTLQALNARTQVFHEIPHADANLGCVGVDVIAGVVGIHKHLLRCYID